MRIAHVSDIHIRNLKFHPDYKRVFSHFYRELEEQRIDVVVNTGDTAHTKTNISPEFVSVASEFISQVAKRVRREIIVLGNHDLNLMNEDRQDAITPIIEALKLPNVHLLKKSSEYLYDDLPGFAFHNFGIADSKHWTPGGPYDEDKINIGLFHGALRNCITDSNFRMTMVEHDLDLFEGLDFVMMGDIHKRQSFRDGKVWYPGSMIQQNFGEDPEKGYLIWDIKSKEEATVEFRELKGNRKFYTVRLSDTLALPAVNIEPDSRVRVLPPRSLTLVEQKGVQKLIEKRWSPHDVIVLGAKSLSQVTDGTPYEKTDNLRDPSMQEELLRQFLSKKKLSDAVLAKILELNRKYQVEIEQRDDVARNVKWRVLKMGWNNIYNYGEGNVIDFSQIKGLTGIFAPNSSGKSGLIDIITIGAWDANTKEVARNVHLINDNKDSSIVIMDLLANGERYTIQRELERIKQPQKSGPDKEWGKTTLDFVHTDREGIEEKLVGETRPQTESNIRRRIGTFDDFMLTGLFAQWDPMDLIMCKETDRKRILFKFLDLDIFESKAKLAKDESREWFDRLADFEDSNYEQLRAQLSEEQNQDHMQLVSFESLKGGAEFGIAELHRKIEELQALKVPVSTCKKIEPKNIAELEKKIDEAKGRALLHDMEIDAFTGDMDNIHRARCQYDPVELDKKADELYDCNQKLYSLETLVKHQKFVVSEREKQVKLLGQVPCGDQFPSCQFLVSAFKARDELAQLRASADSLEAEAAGVQKQIDELVPFKLQQAEYLKLEEEYEHARGKLTSHQHQHEVAQLTVQKLEAELVAAKIEMERYEQNKRDIEKNELIQGQISEVRAQLVEHEKGLKLIEHDLTELHKTMGAREKDIERLDKQITAIKEVRDTCSAFEHFLEAMGKDGIALQVLRQKLPIVNEEINKILSGAAEFGAYIEYDEEDQSIRLYLQYGQYKSRVLELGGGAEKFLASVAIRSALLSISSLPRSNMFIIDEGFGKLDPQNLEAVQRMFDYLKSVFDHVIVISHTDIMKDMVDNVIDIVPDDEGYAHVEVGN